MIGGAPRWSTTERCGTQQVRIFVRDAEELPQHPPLGTAPPPTQGQLPGQSWLSLFVSAVFSLLSKHTTA